jgi:hypothetical protein
VRPREKYRDFLILSERGREHAMKAMILDNLCNLNEKIKPLSLVDLPEPIPENTEILIRITVCGVIRIEDCRLMIED